ncbi:murein DD-endopeptidase MepM/ murein hydrolase activator NlpD [Geodermatophilus bullaregiensis]|uniref:M23 family metallopeptidase n=1 Tax=Geodermatophilus bullaregiensis TaxID=1564160 RepID=UPI0027DD6F12|nr:M23 family metallopeptidase [Geodermatophilus bullaregiensis]MBM7807732.1 murein DD-endopeptidase MepM/ murein hydrolase activator NlpD [Geodermatophilus bullaregiensis]
MPGPRTGAHRRADARRVSPLRGFPPVRPDLAGPSVVLPTPRAAREDFGVPAPVAVPSRVAVPSPVTVAALATAVLPVDELAVDEAPVDQVADVEVSRSAVADVPAEAGTAAPRAARRGRARDRRPHLLLAALVAGALGAGAFGLHGAPDAAAEPASALTSQDQLLTDDEAVEVMPMASITEAEAQARLQEVAASRAARAAAEAAAAEAAAEAARPKTVLPVDGARFTSGFGGRWGTFHYGIDLAAPMRTPEMAAADGVVLRAGAASGFGLAVYVLHENGDVTVYGHMDEILVEPGQYVEAGETIALLGNRGQSTGPHLHFEVHQGGMNGQRIDPVDWLAERGVEI